tara:strand:+ start:46448 stop:47653 length:1206 start_codon:yes stop_codon:yes gene_type:complete
MVDPISTGSAATNGLPEKGRFADRLTYSTRAALFYLGVFVPAVFVVISFAGLVPRPDWQSGQLRDIVGFLLHPTGGLPIYPFLIFSVISLAFYLRDELVYGNAFWVRLGIASGVVVSLWYGVAFSLTIGGVDPNDVHTWVRAATIFLLESTAALMFIGVCFLVRVFWTQKDRERRNHCIVIAMVLSGIFFGATLAIHGPNVARDGLMFIVYLPVILVLISLLAAPGFALLAYSFACIRILITQPASHRVSLLETMLFTTWAASFLAACRLSIKMSLSAYASLPTQRPSDCYVATAAARGHQRFVRVRHIGADGMRINQQLTTFKAFELMLQAVAPRLHLPLRRLYDWIGPQVIPWIQHPIAADIAYAGLKPAEWFAWIMLCIALGRERDVAQHLYGNDKST